MVSKWAANLTLVAAVVVWVANLALAVLLKDYDQSEGVNAVVLAIIGALLVTRPRNGNGNGNGTRPT
jgi:hypothetical protein